MPQAKWSLEYAGLSCANGLAVGWCRNPVGSGLMSRLPEGRRGLLQACIWKLDIPGRWERRARGKRKRPLAESAASTVAPPLKLLASIAVARCTRKPWIASAQVWPQKNLDTRSLEFPGAPHPPGRSGRLSQQKITLSRWRSRVWGLEVSLAWGMHPCTRMGVHLLPWEQKLLCWGCGALDLTSSVGYICESFIIFLKIQ